MFKKWLVFGLIVIFSASILYSQDKKDDEYFIKVQLLINENFPNNYQQIKWYSDKLSSEQRLYIYEDMSKSGVLPFFFNLFPSFCFGSWIQGDITGGLIGTIGMVSGLTLFSAFWGEESALFGTLLFLSSYITGLVSPWTYASGYNSKLRDALRMSELSDIMIVPSVNVAKNNLNYPTANLRIHF